MKHLKILHRVTIVASVPMLVLIAILAVDMTARYDRLQALDKARAIAVAMPLITEFTHKLQAERGMSASYVASGRKRALQDNLAARRKATDASARRLDEGLAALLAAAPGADANPAVRAAQDARAALPDLRRAVDSDAALADLLKAYTARVSALRDGVTGFARGVDALDFRALVVGLSMQLQLSEYAGLERAVGASGVAAGGFSEGLFLRFLRLSQNQSGAAEMIDQWSAPEVAEAVQAAMATPEARKVEELRRRILLADGAVPDGFPDSAGWFAAATDRIGRLAEAEAATLARIDETAAALHARTSAAFWSQIAALALGALAMIGVVWFGARSVAAPLHRLATQAKALAWGNLAVIPYQDQRNEIGELARSVTEFNRMVTVSMRNASALECSSSALMITNDTFDIVFVNPRLEASLLRSKDHFAKSNPDVDFKSLRGLNIDIFHENPDRNRGMLTEMNGVMAAEIGFDERRFELMVAPVEREGKRLGYVVEWVEVSEARRLQEQISDVIARVRQGDFSGRIEIESEEAFMIAIRDGINDIGAVMGAFMAEMQTAISAGAHGDLTARLSAEHTGELARLAADMNEMFDGLGALISGIKDRSGALSHVSGDLLDASRDLSARAESQASALTETAQAMSALTENMAANRARVSDVRGAAETAGRQADEGREVVESAVAAVSRMEASTARVKEFTGLIDEIAFQTNLLALNAAVEAARAGEAGKGFAVVATEVRSLAQRASEASREIGEVIAESAAHAEEGVSLVTRTGATIGALLDAVQKVSATMGEVDAAIENQTSGIAEMDMAMKDVDQITQQNTELAQHSAHAAERLNEQSEGLRDDADKFRTAEEDARARAA